MESKKYILILIWIHMIQTVTSYPESNNEQETKQEKQSQTSK